MNNNGNSGMNENRIHTDVSDILIRKSAGISTFMYDMLNNGRTGRFSPAKSFKHEWMNLVLTPKTFTVTGWGGSTVVEFEAGAPLPKAGYVMDITRYGTHTGIIIRILSMDVNTATVEFVSGDVSQLNTGDVANVVSEGVEEGRDFIRGTFENGDLEYNYTQNFDEGYTISGSMEQMDVYASLNKPSVQADLAIDRYLQKLSLSAVRGVRYTTVNGAGKRVSGMGGLRSFINVPGGNTMLVSGTVTKNDLARLASMISDKGGNIGVTKIYCNSSFAPIFDAFNTISVGIKDNVRGGAPEYILLTTGQQVKIEYDPTIPANEIYMVNTNEAALIPLGNRNGYFAAPIQGTDNITRALIAEFTLEIHNAKTSHGMITVV